MQPAGFLRRIAAVFYDSLLVAAVLFLATLPFIAMRSGEPVEPGDPVYQIVLLVVTYSFFVGFWTRRGRTLGMQSWGLQLQDAAGAPPTIVACSVRFAVAIVSWAVFGLGFLWQLVDKDNLTWHDRASGTRLVYYPKTSG